MTAKNRFSLSLLLLIITVCCTAKTILLHPAGNITNPGRAIGTSFERGLTLQCAHLLQEALITENVKQNHNYTVLISNKAGQNMDTYEHAQYVNQRAPDICITLNMYADQNSSASINIFHYANSAREPTHQEQMPFFIPIERAHEHYYAKSKQYAHKLYTTLLSYSSVCVAHKPIACPYAPLMGIAVPALAIEIGIHENNWQLCVEPLAQALIEILGQA